MAAKTKKVTKPNRLIQQSLGALVVLTSSPNRLEMLAGLSAMRSRDNLRLAWKQPGEQMNKYVEDHGETHEDGRFGVKEGGAAWVAYQADVTALLDVEQEIKIEPLKWADIKKGWSRNSEGKRCPLEWSAEEQFALVQIGILSANGTDPKPK